jgi:pectinesterase inhibitor-like protein
MATAGARAVLIVLGAAAVALQLASAPASAAGRDNIAAVAEVCKNTPFPELCTGSTQKHARKYDTVDPLTVLEMQVDAFKKRVRAASRRAKREAKTAATPEQRRALNICKSFYLDAGDNLGACKRAIGFRDAVTIRATMGMAAQDMQNCDEEFRKAAAKNPVCDLNRSLVDMSENCRALSNLIPAS